MLRSLLKRLMADCSGGILILFGLSIIFLVGIAGAGYDLGHQQLVRQKLQQATDAAALAASSMLPNPNDPTDKERTAMAQRFFELNYPKEYFGVKRPEAKVSIGANDVTVAAEVPIETSFVANFGIETLPAHGFTKAQFKKGASKIDLIIAMDSSESMGIQDVTATSLTLLPSSWGNVRSNCIDFFYAYWFGYTEPKSGIYVADKTAATNVCDNYVKTKPDFGPSKLPWSEVSGASRVNAMRYAAQTAATKLLTTSTVGNRIGMITWADYDYNPPSPRPQYLATNSVLKFETSMSKINSFMSKIFLWGGTDSTTGLKAAEAMSKTSPAKTIRAVILLTDGGNGENVAPKNVQRNTSSLGYCTSLKKDGVFVYTIAFGKDATNPAYPLIKPFLSDCATGPNGGVKSNGKYPNEGTYFFVAPTAKELQDTFDKIVDSLQTLKITQ